MAPQSRGKLWKVEEILQGLVICKKGRFDVVRATEILSWGCGQTQFLHSHPITSNLPWTFHNFNAYLSRCKWWGWLMQMLVMALCWRCWCKLQIADGHYGSLLKIPGHSVLNCCCVSSCWPSIHPTQHEMVSDPSVNFQVNRPLALPGISHR